MNMAGRFTTYYWWMAFLPLAVAVTFVATRHRLWGAVLGVAAMLLTVSGIRSMLPDGHWSYGNIRSFVQRQHFKSSDAVVCPFSMFYEIKPACDTCYFIGIFPIEFLDHVDYIIDVSDGDEFDKPVTDYVKKLKTDTTIVLSPIDRCEYPSLTLYQVKKRNE